MSNITPAQVIRLQCLRRELHMDEDAYRAMIAGASAGRTTSTKWLSQVEAMQIIDSLSACATPTVLPGDAMRKKILSRFHTMQWYKDGKLDWQRIAGWMKQYSYLHKPLNNYTEQELPALVSQVETVYKSYLKAV